MSASSASRSDLAMTLGPIARACGAQHLGRPPACDAHLDVLTRKGVGEGLAYLAESYNCVTHILLRFRFEIDSLPFNGVGTQRGQQRHGVDSGNACTLVRAISLCGGWPTVTA